MPENNQIPEKELLLFPSKDKILQDDLVAFMSSHHDASFDNVRDYAKEIKITEVRIEVTQAMFAFSCKQLAQTTDPIDIDYLNRTLDYGITIIGYKKQLLHREMERLSRKMSD